MMDPWACLVHPSAYSFFLCLRLCVNPSLLLCQSFFLSVGLSVWFASLILYSLKLREHSTHFTRLLLRSTTQLVKTAVSSVALEGDFYSLRNKPLMMSWGLQLQHLDGKQTEVLEKKTLTSLIKDAAELRSTLFRPWTKILSPATMILCLMCLLQVSCTSWKSNTKLLLILLQPLKPRCYAGSQWDFKYNINTKHFKSQLE